MSIVLTVGTNTYISLSDANTYLSLQLYTEPWNDASDDDKSKALLLACKHIERLNIRGMKAVSTQTLKFPRAIYSYEIYYRAPLVPNHFQFGAGYYTETSVSQLVKDAQCEEALAILSQGSEITQRTLLQQSGVSNITALGTSETYTHDTTNRARLQSPIAKDIMAYYLKGTIPIV